MDITQPTSRIGIKFRAGFGLLDKFQNQWAHIHNKSVNNVNKTKEVLKKLDRVEESTKRRQKALDNFVEGYKSLSKLDDQIKNIETDLRSLEINFIQIEELLLKLKAHKEQSDATKYFRSVESSYEQQVREQTCLSEARKERMKLEHLQRVQQFEEQQQKDLEERRAVLERAFEEEKNMYLQTAREKKQQ